ncbi:MAG TPA: hypothetical protein ENJ95_08755 [Bacteroidetes bacterium]|nr:hypothetical protein [Bacteroidota bacterium]
MKNTAILLFFAAIFLTSCDPPDPYHYGRSDFIEMKKDPCFGFCPVYSFKIDGKGNAVFEGQRNVPKEGTWARALSADETNQLFEAFEKAGFWDFEDEYTAQVTDLPTTWVSLRLAGKSKTIKDYYGAPEGLKKLEKLVEGYAETDTGWKKTNDVPVAD